MAPGEMVPPRGGLVSADEVRGADHRRDADHEQQGPEQPGGRRQIPTVEEFKAAVERERLAAIRLTPCG